jgi:hypothetical protein
MPRAPAVQPPRGAEPRDQDLLERSRQNDGVAVVGSQQYIEAAVGFDSRTLQEEAGGLPEGASSATITRDKPYQTWRYRFAGSRPASAARLLARVLTERGAI